MKVRDPIITLVVALAVPMLALALALLATSCETELFRCDGVDQTTGGPLCHCVANGLLCGHSGFEPCLACEVPK